MPLQFFLKAVFRKFYLIHFFGQLKKDILLSNNVNNFAFRDIPIEPIADWVFRNRIFKIHLNFLYH